MSDVTLEHIKKAYGDNVVVNDFTLKVKEGEFVSFLGPSGCGKTTTLRMVSGLEQPTSGKILLGNDVVNDVSLRTFIPPEKRLIGMVFQSYAVWPHMTVYQNVAYPLKIKKVKKDELKTRVLKAISQVRLNNLEKRYPHQLSGGQQQRVALARALVMKPRVLLLDEPLSNLDAKLREEMRVEIRELQREIKVTVIYVTHDQIEALTMSNRIVVMDKGIIQQIGTPEELQKKPTNEFVRSFLASSS
ncbi:MAG: ABC transporter substrate-binding protein [Deltaproteobacteria bacterium RIFCSPHIGHO2_12_FULL_43_9]|nr:MAG: ABC transporter substrate-binding protein [Deltaproteobacteria bacterium RIFCSPHIGHO2_12_FULL_43_9]